MDGQASKGGKKGNNIVNKGKVSEKNPDYWAIKCDENTYTGDIHDILEEYVKTHVLSALESYEGDEDLEYEENENRKGLQNNEREACRALRTALLAQDKFINVIVGNHFSTKFIKADNQATFHVGPIRIFIFSVRRVAPTH